MLCGSQRSGTKRRGWTPGRKTFRKLLKRIAPQEIEDEDEDHAQVHAQAAELAHTWAATTRLWGLAERHRRAADGGAKAADVSGISGR